MPRLLFARPAHDAAEERQIRTVARSRHAPADWIQRARMIVRSWDGLRPTAIAAELGCHPQTVRERLARFNAAGIDGLGDRPGAGRKPRLTEAARSQVIALIATDPPGKLVRQRDGELRAADESEPAHWTLDSLTAAAQARGITISRSQVRRILKAEGVRWRQPRSWADSPDPEFVPKGRRSSPATRRRRQARRPSVSTTLGLDELGPVSARTYPPAADWSPDGHRIKAPLQYRRGPEKIWVYGALRVCDGQAVTLTASSRNTTGYLRLLAAVAVANPDGDLYLVTDNLASHKSPPIQAWLAAHPRVQQVFVPTGACWLHLQAGGWRLFRGTALAGQTFANAEEITQATRVATQQLNCRATPWIGGRPSPPKRYRRRRFVYALCGMQH